MAAPRRKPAPVFQPPQTNPTQVPTTAITAMIRPMRAAARSKLNSSGAAIVGIPQDLSDEADEARHAAQNQEDDLQPGGAEGLIEGAANQQSYERRDRQQQRESRVLGVLRRPGG